MSTRRIIEYAGLIGLFDKLPCYSFVRGVTREKHTTCGMLAAQMRHVLHNDLSFWLTIAEAPHREPALSSIAAGVPCRMAQNTAYRPLLAPVARPGRLPLWN